MPEINVNGITIHFPYEPYSIQIDYMSKIIQAIEGRTHAVLESPTGTGKVCFFFKE